MRANGKNIPAIASSIFRIREKPRGTTLGNDFQSGQPREIKRGLRELAALSAHGEKVKA